MLEISSITKKLQWKNNEPCRSYVPKIHWYWSLN